MGGDDWIECREVLSGRVLYYHVRTMQIVFDTLPSDEETAVVSSSTRPKARSVSDAEDDVPLTPVTAREKLLNYKSAWDFFNPRCERFRARASRINHAVFMPPVEALVYPRYCLLYRLSFPRLFFSLSCFLLSQRRIFFVGVVFL